MNWKCKSAYFAPLVFAIFLMGGTACKKEKISIDGDAMVFEPLVCPQGSAEGDVVTQTIGVAGGILQSSDQRISIEIPPGALNADVVIGVQPISNSNIAGIGQAYRLTPHGQVFSKPIKITYSWADFADHTGLLNTLGFAYQQTNGIWRFVGASGNDEGQKKIYFNTKHFSDWSLMNRLSLSPYQANLETGAKQMVKALIFTEPSWEDLFVPLVNNPDGEYNEPGYPVGEPVALPAKFIQSWQLNGVGKIVTQATHTVEYQAPATVNGYASASIILQLRASVPGSYFLICQITIVDGWIELRMNGGTPVRFPASTVVQSGGRYLLSNPEDEGGGYFLLTWQGGLGTYPFDLDNQGTYFHFLTPSKNYVSRYIPTDGSDILPSEGNVTITKMANGRVEGSFSVNKVGVDEFLKPQASAQGSFSAKLF